MSILDDMPDGGAPFDPFLVPDDWARLEYGRMLWKKPEMRRRLSTHWTHERHPYRDRFITRYRELVEMVLEAAPGRDEELDTLLRQRGYSLRTIIREIPPVFGAFF